MRKVKRRIFAGAVCEQIVYPVSDRASDVKKAQPRLRFKTAEEREQHKLNISRRNHARAFNANFRPSSLYSTLTFDDEHEIHDFASAKKVRDLYIRRLKYACPDAVIFCYIGKGKGTHRMHLHMVSEGVSEELIKVKWGYGKIKRISHLREHNYYGGKNCGQDYTGLANYLFDHWTPEQGGHRWKQTRNAIKVEREDATECKREYSENRPPIAPKGYVLTEYHSTEYGYQWFKYAKIPVKKKRQKELHEGSSD